MMFDPEFGPVFDDAVRILGEGFSGLPELPHDSQQARIAEVLNETALRLRQNYPYHHPLYVGQMLKPPHPVARLAYALAMQLNPNNHALDGGRATSEMEKACVAELARMFGWQTHLGHLCGGGTMANFEALWIARELHPGQAIAASELAHYTHARLAAVLGIPFVKIGVDSTGRMDVAQLEHALAEQSIGAVVATLGTTAAGTVDPLHEIVSIAQRHRARVHVDAAYGGYYTLANNLTSEARRAFDAIPMADSLVIDPHKHGLQPYGCGCVLFRDPSVGRFYRHDSPYTYFTSDELHLGEISLECSRAGASAAALWATMRLLPPEPGGEFARGLVSCRAAALELHQTLSTHPRVSPLFPPELDIVVWAVRASTSAQASQSARLVFDAAARHDLHLALASMPRTICEPAKAIEHWTEDSLVCLRACVMKPEHKAWMPEILSRLDSAMNEALAEVD